MSVTVAIDVTENIAAIVGAARSRAGMAVAKTARDIEARAKAAAPVDTGNLRNSIEASQAGPFNWQVAVAAEYGIYVEFGTRKMSAQPYFVPAAEAAGPILVAALGRLV